MHAVIGAGVAGHQLDIVQDDQIKAKFHIQAAALGAQRQWGDRGGVVQPDAGIGQHFHSMGEERPFMFFQFAGAQTLGINAGFLGDQTLDKLLARHFQREDGHVFFVLLAGVFGNGKQEARLTHARTTGNNQQVRFLQPTQKLIQVIQAGGHTVDIIPELGERVHPVVIGAEDGGNGLQVVLDAPLRQAKDRLFGLTEDVVHSLALVIGQAGHLIGGLQHPPPHRVGLHNAAVGFGVHGGGGLVDQRSDIGRAANFGQVFAFLQFLANGQVIEGDAALVQAVEGLPEPAVADNVEIIGAQELGDIVVGFGVNQDGAQHRLFGLPAVGLGLKFGLRGFIFKGRQVRHAH